MKVGSDDYAMIAEAAAGWLGDGAPVSRFRASRHRGEVTDPELWRGMAAMGWAGLMVPEQHGGSGLGLVAMSAVSEAAGRSLATAPLVGVAVGAVVAIAAGASAAQQAEWLPPIASGEATPVLAIDASRPGDPTLAARRRQDGWVLDGRLPVVLDGLGASSLIVPARDGDEVILLMVPAEAAIGERRDLVDGRDYASVSFEGVEVAERHRLDGGDVPAALARAVDAMVLAHAQQMLGSAQAAFDLTIDYLKTREQFGQLIGSFQGLQHRAALILVELELARASLEAALEAFDTGATDVPEQTSQAKAMVCKAAHLATNEAVQMHGGIGMTEEHDSGLFLKAVRVAENLLGSAAWHRDRFARLRGF